MAELKSNGGRPRKGSLVWRKSGWHGRFWALVDGEWIRVIRPLGTDNKAVASRKLARLVIGAISGAPDAIATKQGETYAEAAERIRARREDEGLADAANERMRDRLHVLPSLGKMPVNSIRPVHVRAVLEAARHAGKSRQTIRHIRWTMHTVFAALWRDELIAENPVARVQIPKVPKDNRERAVLTDAELAVYLAWQHPDDHHRLPVLQRQTMACVARMFGGLRTGDLHALTWQAFDTESGRFAHGWAPRKKTARPQLLEVPEMLRPILRDWWERQGRPVTGLVFPVLRGELAGRGEKHGVSHASALRRDMRRAFGLERWRPERHSWESTPVRKMTPRERELLDGTDTVKPVDFHSWRRAFNQALADADVNAQQAAALAGHSDLGSHARYLANTAKMRRVPEAALPKLVVHRALLTADHRTVLAASVPKRESADQDSSCFPARPARFERATCGFEVRCSIQLS